MGQRRGGLFIKGRHASSTRSHGAWTWGELNKLQRVAPKITRLLRARARDFRASCFDKRAWVNLPSRPEGSKEGNDLFRKRQMRINIFPGVSSRLSPLSCVAAIPFGSRFFLGPANRLYWSLQSLGVVSQLHFFFFSGEGWGVGGGGYHFYWSLLCGWLTIFIGWSLLWGG